MAITIHSPRELEGMSAAGAVAAATLASVVARIAPGVSTADIDAWVREDTARRGARPSQLGYHGFPAAVCTSVNEVVCHGIPSTEVVLQDGDIVNVDVTSEIGGFHGDTSRTIAVGEVSEERAHVLRAAEACLAAGIAAVRPGARLGDIGAAIVAEARRQDCDLVREYTGHGIGRAMHMPPHVHHFARAGTGTRLRPGMTFTIEPMVVVGSKSRHVRLLDDGWTVVTEDGGPSAQAEHTVAVTEDGVRILTPRPR